MRTEFPRAVTSNPAPTEILGDIRTAIAARSVRNYRGLVRHVTDLFVVNAQQLSENDVALFDDVLNDLIHEIDTAARALLALRLAPINNAPTTLMRALARDDEPDVACPVLMHSRRLDDPTLLEAARHKGQEHLFAISRRQALSPAVTDVLVGRGDIQVLFSVAENAGAEFSDLGFECLIKRAAGHDSLVERIGRRKDLSPRMLARLIRTASDQVLVKLQREFPHLARNIDNSVQGAAIHIAAKYESEATDVDAVRAAIRQLHDERQLDDEQVRSFADDGLLTEVRIALSFISGLSETFIDQALKQESGEMLLVIARGIGLSWSTVERILRLPIWRRPATAAERRHCLGRYEKLDHTTAADIMRFYKARLSPAVAPHGQN